MTNIKPLGMHILVKPLPTPPVETATGLLLPEDKAARILARGLVLAIPLHLQRDLAELAVKLDVPNPMKPGVVVLYRPKKKAMRVSPEHELVGIAQLVGYEEGRSES